MHQIFYLDLTITFQILKQVKLFLNENKWFYLLLTFSLSLLFQMLTCNPSNVPTKQYVFHHFQDVWFSGACSPHSQSSSLKRIIVYYDVSYFNMGFVFELFQCSFDFRQFIASLLCLLICLIRNLLCSRSVPFQHSTTGSFSLNLQ